MENEERKAVEQWAAEDKTEDWALAAARAFNGWRALGLQMAHDEFRAGVAAALEVKFA